MVEFDVQQWLGENLQDDEDDNSYVCPVCDSSDHEDSLLLCDGCNAAYHTECIGLSSVPEGDWFCMECAHLCDIAPNPRALAVNLRDSNPQRYNRSNNEIRHQVRGQHVRTRGQQRRARRQAREDDWQGPWGHFTHRLFDLSDLDLDNVDDEDEDLGQFRRYQQLDRRELDRWRQRYAIARRLGARDEFVQQIPPQISEHLQSDPEPPQPPAESQDERRAWGAFERARDAEVASSNTNSRKRKARSDTGSPSEPMPEPERKLKRPRTRRLPTQFEAASHFPAGPSSSRAANGTVRSPGQSTEVTGGPLVSALLKELEPHTPTDDENPITIFGWRVAEATSPARSPAGSPAMSPTSSVLGSPRALSLTPPPLPSFGGRPGSPTLSLSTHIEPRYPPANYSPTRNRGSHSDSESSAQRLRRRKERRAEPKAEPEPESKDKFPESRPLELRQPRPRRPSEIAPRSEEQMSLRLTMTPEEKKSINDIVKTALKPHWRAQKLTTEQYSIINRDISRKLYDEVKDAISLDEETRRKWETRASQEVAQAVASLQA